MRVRIEIDPEGKEEVVVRCRELTEQVRRLRDEIMGVPSAGGEMLLTLGGREYIVALGDILFFESCGDRTAAHTAGRMFYTDRTLSDLLGTLPGEFCRGAKSCIVNLRRISSFHRELTGVCEVCFAGSNKKIYVSRMYYKPFRERLGEVRFGEAYH